MANDAKFNFYLNRQGARGQKGEKGDQGFSPSITVNTNTADEYTLLIQNEYDSFVTDNIRPTYDDRGGTYVRVDRANNVQYFGSADIATTANYGEVKLAQASDLASTVDVGNSNVITAELLKTWFDGQLADNLVTTTNNVTIQGQKIFATPTRFMDTVRIGNRLVVSQEDTGVITFDSDNTGTLIGTHLTSTGDASFSQNITVDGIATIKGGLNVAGNAVISNPQLGNTTISGDLTTNADINIQGQKVHLQHTNPTMYLKNMNGVNEIEIFRGLFTAGNPSPADNYLNLGHSQLQLNLTGKAIKANGKDVATSDTVNAIQSDLNIAKQDIIEAQGDIDNLQMNKQNKLTAGSGITIDADNVISATGGSTGDVSAAGDNTFTGENTFNGAVNLNGTNIAENLTVNRNLTSSGEINAVSIKTTGLRSDDIKTTTNKKYLTEVDVDNQTIQVVDGKLHANLDELGNEVNTLSGEVAGLSGDVTTLSGKVTAVEGKTTDLESAVENKQDKLTAGEGIQIEQITDGALPLSWYRKDPYGGTPNPVPIATPIASEIDIQQYIYPCYGSNLDPTTTHSASIKYTMRVRRAIFDMQYRYHGLLAFEFGDDNYIKYEYSNNGFTIVPQIKNGGANINLNVSQNYLSVAEGDLITTEIAISSSKKTVDMKVYNKITGTVYATATASNIEWVGGPAGATSPYFYYNGDDAMGLLTDSIAISNMEDAQTQNIISVKPDGTTIIINDDGTISAVGGGGTPSDIPVTGVSAPLKLSSDTVNVPEMTGNVTDGFTVTASRFSATWSNQYYKCFNADGTGWYAGNPESGSDYIQIVFPRLLHLRGAYIKQNDNTNSLVSNYTLLITQNGTDWTEVLSDKLPQTVNYETSKIINSNCLGFRFRADGNYETNGAAIRGITLDLTELPTTATLGYDDNFVLDDSNQLSLNSAKFGKLSSPILDVPVNNCVLAMPTAPTFDGTNVKVYAGTKVAIPNGLNADGTCKSNIVTLTTDATINQSTFNGDVTLMLKSDGTIDQTAYSYFEVDDISTITTLTAYCWYYDRKTNNHYLASSEGAKQGPYQRIKIGSYNQASTTSAGGKENALRYFRFEKPLSLHKESEFNFLPDYTKPSPFTNNVIIVADKDYWVCGQFNVDTKQESTIKFYNSSGTTAAEYDLCSGSAYTNRRFHNIPIPKGTIYMIACTNESFNAKIFPCIGGVNG